MLRHALILFVRTQSEPSLSHSTALILLQPPRYGKISHRLLHAISKGTLCLRFSSRKCSSNTSLASGKDFPVAAVPMLPKRPAKIAVARVFKKPCGRRTDIFFVVAGTGAASAMGEVTFAQLYLQEDGRTLFIRQMPPKNDIDCRCGFIANRRLSTDLAQECTGRNPFKANLVDGKTSANSLAYTVR